MPDNSHLLPGVKGKDYHFVRYGGNVYVVYNVSEQGLPNFRISFKIEPKDYDAYGIQPSNVGTVNGSTFQSFQHLGLASEIIRNADEHPFDQYLRDLKRLNGNVSWLDNKEFLGVMLEGFMKGWDSTQTQQALTQTNWYQSRTQTQRDWIQLSRADRKAAVEGINAQMTEELRNLYGPDYALKDTGLNQKRFDQIAQRIASGALGTADEGFQLWGQRMRDRAEKVEGTPAWIAREQQLEQTNQFNNRPENMFETIKDQAYAFLGPQGRPDNATLKRWADSLVVGRVSEADWQQYLQRQARSLYPWLDPGESWQDRAATYKNIAEQDLGRPVNWDDALLGKIGQTDAEGKSTGLATSFDDFRQQVRSDGRFLQSSVAAQEFNGLFNKINATFNGSGAV